MDEDGDLDLILPQFFDGESLVWLEQPTDPTSTWTKHVINDDTGRGFKTEVRDMNSDGRPDLVYANPAISCPRSPTSGSWACTGGDSTGRGSSRPRGLGHVLNVVYEGFSVVEPEVAAKVHRASSTPEM